MHIKNEGPWTRISRRAASAVLVALALTVALITATAQAQTAAQVPQKLRSIRLHAGMHQISAEVAQTPLERQIGLMGRPTMGANEGMLFIFDAPETQCFWMRNTLLPLTAAFLADDGSIVNLVDMQPQTETSHCSARPVRYVLEMNQGWFAKRGFTAGQKIGGGPFAAERK